MIQHINEIYQPKLLDGLKPITKKKHEQDRLENKLHSAKALLMISELAEKAGIELTQGEELTRQAVELVKIDEQHNTFDRAVMKYDKRQDDYQQGRLGEKVQRFFTGAPVNPALQGAAPQQQPQFVVVNQDDTLRTQVEQLTQSVAQLAGAFAQATAPPQAQAQPQPQVYVQPQAQAQPVVPPQATVGVNGATMSFG